MVKLLRKASGKYVLRLHLRGKTKKKIKVTNLESSLVGSLLDIKETTTVKKKVSLIDTVVSISSNDISECTLQCNTPPQFGNKHQQIYKGIFNHLSRSSG